MDKALVYFADPMCSWCWGFSPAIARVASEHTHEMPLTVVMGGLFAGTARTWDDHTKTTIKEHWHHVEEASGQPFDHRFFEREDFIYDTEPSCRAVVTARRMSQHNALPFLAALQGAFYRDGRDITRKEILIEIASEFGIDGDAFDASFDSPETLDETQRDFALSQRAGVQGFPTLMGLANGQPMLLSPGFQSDETIDLILQRFIDYLPPATEPA
ncbi:MAG: DsbA family protein [Pseudomonadota bacterium]